jgi:hypothetical protein
MRWGLIPSWSKDSSGAARMINARSETASTMPAFRDAIGGRSSYCRCCLGSSFRCQLVKWRYHVNYQTVIVRSPSRFTKPILPERQSERMMYLLATESTR